DPEVLPLRRAVIPRHQLAPHLRRPFAGAMTDGPHLRRPEYGHIMPHDLMVRKFRLTDFAGRGAFRIHGLLLAKGHNGLAGIASYAFLGFMMLSRTDWKASGETLKWPRNGLSMAAVRKISNPMKMAMIETRMA